MKGDKGCRKGKGTRWRKRERGKKEKARRKKEGKEEKEGRICREAGKVERMKKWGKWLAFHFFFWREIDFEVE